MAGHERYGVRGRLAGEHPGQLVRRQKLPNWGDLPPGLRLALNVSSGHLELWLTDLDSGVEASKPISMPTIGHEEGYLQGIVRPFQELPAAARIRAGAKHRAAVRRAGANARDGRQRGAGATRA
jgi:hypothetical protein